GGQSHAHMLTCTERGDCPPLSAPAPACANGPTLGRRCPHLAGYSRHGTVARREVDALPVVHCAHPAPCQGSSRVHKRRIASPSSVLGFARLWHSPGLYISPRPVIHSPLVVPRVGSDGMTTIERVEKRLVDNGGPGPTASGRPSARAYGRCTSP